MQIQILVTTVFQISVTRCLVKDPCFAIKTGVFNCSNHGIQTIPSFPDWTTSIDLSDNHIKVVDTMLSNLRKLVYLSLSNNWIEDISTTAFLNLTSLQCLDLSFNRLYSSLLDNVIFPEPNNLDELSLQGNTYTDYPERLMTRLISLKKLHVDVFTGFAFGGGFLSLQNLYLITFHPRSLCSLINTTFSGLSKSPITDLNLDFGGFIIHPVEAGVLSPFYSLKTIKIDLKIYCSIRDALRLLHGLRNRSLDLIDLSGNMMAVSSVVRLTYFDILPLSKICVRTVNLENNDIIEMPLISLSNSVFSQCIEDFSIARNSFQGCSFISLIPIFSFPKIQGIDFSDINSLQNIQLHSKADSPIHRIGKRIKWLFREDAVDVNLKTQQGNEAPFQRPLLIIYISKSLKKINGSKIYARNGHSPPDLDIVIEAPGLEVLDLAYTGISICKPGFNITAKSNIKVLNISGWICSELNIHALDSLQTLEILVWRNSGLDKGLEFDTKGMLFSKLPRLMSLDLSENNLQTLHINLFKNQTFTLQTVLLHNNEFTHIPTNIGTLSKLRYLGLKNNKISYLSDTDISLLGKLHNVGFMLSGNAFTCSCENMNTLRWMFNNKHKLLDYDKLKCSDGNALSNITQKMDAYEIKCASKFWLEFSVTLSVILICVIILSAVGVRYRTTLEYFYLRLRMFVQKYQPVPEEEGYDFDAFLSYSHHDTDWVASVLYKNLTTKHGKNICIHHKDFRVGRWISDEIIRCIDQSRNVVFVITIHFLESEWSTYEMEIARMHAFRSGRSGLVMIMKDPIPLQRMPNVLKRIWWRVVCLEWPQNDQDESAINLFWEKLNNALKTN